MFSALKQLLFPTSPSTPPAVGKRPAPGGRKYRPADVEGTTIRMSPADIDAAFYDLMLGVQSTPDCKPNTFETRALRELDRLLASDIHHSSLVPRLPAVIPRIMSTLRDQESSTTELAIELGRDAVLVGEVIRLSNSPYYRAGKEITSLERAVFTLGRTGIRQLVVHAAFKPLINLNAGHFTGLSGPLLWEQSEKTALACDCMASKEKADRFNAYLMAIVQNVGLTVALQMLDHTFDGREAPHSQHFRDQLMRSSRLLSLMIARQWTFPPAVLDALEAQIELHDLTKLSTLGTILYLSDKLAKLHTLSCQRRVSSEVRPDIPVPLLHLSQYCRDCYDRLSV